MNLIGNYLLIAVRNFRRQKSYRQYETEDRFGETVIVFTVLAIFIASLGLLGLASFMTSSTYAGDRNPKSAWRHNHRHSWAFIAGIYATGTHRYCHRMPVHMVAHGPVAPVISVPDSDQSLGVFDLRIPGFVDRFHFGFFANIKSYADSAGGHAQV